ncbi:hypothetical protein AeRB84_014923 [Aphanomyces euteiches]|nr:hypothetical protein AeRB84_014923 [Aphanomyces euteiches]
MQRPILAKNNSRHFVGVMNSYHVKYQCLRELEEGTLKPREAARKYKVNNRTISRWKADAESIRQRVEEAPPGAKLTRKPRSDFKRKERILTKDERRFKAYVETRGKMSKLRMSEVISKCQQVLPSSQGKQGHNLYMYVFRWLRRHQLMEYVAFNSTGRPKVHSDEENDDDLLPDNLPDEVLDSLSPTEPLLEEDTSLLKPKDSRSDEMSVIYALAELAQGNDTPDASESTQSAASGPAPASSQTPAAPATSAPPAATPTAPVSSGTNQTA